MTNNEIVQKLWNLCNVLRDDGITYHEYVTELTYILFLRIANELGTEEKIGIPEEYRWNELVKLDGTDLRGKYQEALLKLGKNSSTLGTIYRNAQTRIAEPANLKKIFTEINKIEWYSEDKENLGDLYEGLLEKNASEKKSGAGQYFTPRVLIDSMVRIIKPELGEKICDPAGGTFGFIIEADKYLREKYDDYFGTDERLVTDEEREFQETKAFSACELVPDTHRLGLMNAILHEIGGNFIQGDTLSEFGKQLNGFDIILSNPPFGTKKGGERATRDDLVYDTSNKQLNFLQVIYNSLRTTGKARAAIVLPDNVLFEGGVGKDIRIDLMNKCNLHTILRLPTGIFYAQGVKTNVLFFTRGKSNEENTKEIWYYDLRSSMPNFGKTNPLTKEHFEEFERTFDNAEEKEKLERWTKVTLEEIEKKDYSLDMGLLKVEDNEEELQNPIENGEECIEKLEEALDLLKGILKELDLCGVKKMPKKKENLSPEEKLIKAVIPKEEEPYKIPDNWVWTRLGDIIEQIRGVSYKPVNVLSDKTGIRILRGGNIQESSLVLAEDDIYVEKFLVKEEQLLKKGDIVITSSTGSIKAIGKNTYIKDDIVNTSFGAFLKVVRTEKVNKGLLGHFFQTKSYKKYIEDNVQGVNINNIKNEHIDLMKFPLPPIEEQKRIVEKLDSLFEKTGKIKEIIEEVKEKTALRREAVLSKAFTGELTEKWRSENKTENAEELLLKINEERLKNNPKAKIKDISEMLVKEDEIPYKVPDSWIWTRLEDIVEINPKKKILNFDENEDISFVPMKSVSEETGEIEKIEYEKYLKLKKGYTQFIEEDVLFAKITPCMENGKCAIAKNLKNNIGYGTTEFHVLRCTQVIINKLLHKFLRQESFRKEAQYNMTGSVGFRRVPVDFLKNTLFALPPIEEQKEIVRILDKVFEEENKISELISLENKIEILEKTILDKAFRGELGTGNTDDEPAIELLKRALEENK